MGKDKKPPPTRDLREAVKEAYEKGDDFTKASILGHDMSSASKYMNPHSDEENPNVATNTATGPTPEEEKAARERETAYYATAEARDPKARITPVSVFQTDKAGNLSMLMVKADAMQHAAAHVDLPDNTSPAKLLEGAHKFYKESGLQENQLFDRYMAGDKDAAASLQNKLTHLSDKTEAGAWGRDTWAELEQNRKQYAAATAAAAPAAVTHAATAPAATAPATAKPPKHGK